jgi:excisionase family DNA binding protein
MADSLLLTVTEAAERLRVSPRTVQRLYRDRKLPFIRIGGQVRFPDAALTDWIASQTIYTEDGSRAKEEMCLSGKTARTGGSPIATPAGVIPFTI